MRRRTSVSESAEHSFLSTKIIDKILRRVLWPALLRRDSQEAHDMSLLKTLTRYSLINSSLAPTDSRLTKTDSSREHMNFLEKSIQLQLFILLEDLNHESLMRLSHKNEFFNSCDQ